MHSILSLYRRSVYFGSHNHDQHPFEAGEIKYVANSLEQQALAKNKKEFVIGVDKDNKPSRLKIPGRTIILNQDKWDVSTIGSEIFWDPFGLFQITIGSYCIRLFGWLHQMGAHRFTFLEKNLVVAATDLPDADDDSPDKEHYSKVHVKEGIYGPQLLYKDNSKANEELRFHLVNARW